MRLAPERSAIFFNLQVDWFTAEENLACYVVSWCSISWEICMGRRRWEAFTAEEWLSERDKNVLSLRQSRRHQMYVAL
ncbi:MAG: hypothetical protein JWO91_1432 [Acidobacteriaceae bacterium]|nr:hypothetical protein [Acidobacteriaceae bacterium]